MIIMVGAPPVVGALRRRDRPGTVVISEPAPNPIIHTTTRLAIMATLAAVEEMDFSTVRDAAEVSDSVLSKQAAALESAGYLSIRKGHVGRRPRTWLSLTPGGRTALRSHTAALQRILSRAERPDE
ncbi:winged helix DNA-binding protein [Micromonospora pisi]|uniref:Winged helix DNA-binding protein n=2 Tax=Micromonospora pisi TaxID=589240 RepID=A0A495JRN6_9ACTN|nr:winged helix DNA-binding protein [Micromonospora pisi]